MVDIWFIKQIYKNSNSIVKPLKCNKLIIYINKSKYKNNQGDYFEKNILICWFFDGVYSI